MADMYSGIYAIVNRTNGRFYIGSSATLARRCYVHFWLLRRGEHKNTHLQRAFQKYGEAAFEWVVLCLLPRRDLISTEQRLLDRLAGTAACYNIAAHAHTPSMTEAVRRKIGDALRGRVIPREQVERWIETMRTWRAAQPPKPPKQKPIRKPLSVESRERMANAQRGKRQSEESNRKRSESLRQFYEAHPGHLQQRQRASTESRAKAAASNRGKKRIGVALENLRVGSKKRGDDLRGGTHTPEHRARVSAAVTAWWAERKARAGGQVDG